MTTLDEIQARADAATEGPWEWTKGAEACAVAVPENRDGLYGPLTWDDHNGEVFRESDAQFIAHARTDVPALVKALRAVEAVHKLTYYDKWGRVTSTPSDFGGWCEGCGSFAGNSACKTIRAIQQALDG